MAFTGTAPRDSGRAAPVAHDFILEGGLDVHDEGVPYAAVLEHFQSYPCPRLRKPEDHSTMRTGTVSLVRVQDTKPTKSGREIEIMMIVTNSVFQLPLPSQPHTLRPKESLLFAD